MARFRRSEPMIAYLYSVVLSCRQCDMNQHCCTMLAVVEPLTASAMRPTSESPVSMVVSLGSFACILGEAIQLHRSL